jgi:hypothetical protein
MVNKLVFLDDNQFTNLLVLEPKEQIAIEILVIVIVVITVPEMSIPVWFAVFCEPYVYTSKKMIHENLRFINIHDVPKKLICHSFTIGIHFFIIHSIKNVKFHAIE